MLLKFNWREFNTRNYASSLKQINNMNIERITPVIMGVLMITLIALATSCSTTSKLITKNDYNCPAYH